MADSSSKSDLQQVLNDVRSHLMAAQRLIDSINPHSISGARIQHLLDELDEQTLADIQKSRRSDSID